MGEFGLFLPYFVQVPACIESVAKIGLFAYFTLFDSQIFHKRNLLAKVSFNSQGFSTFVLISFS